MPSFKFGNMRESIIVDGATCVLVRVCAHCQGQQRTPPLCHHCSSGLQLETFSSLDDLKANAKSDGSP